MHIAFADALSIYFSLVNYFNAFFSSLRSFSIGHKLRVLVLGTVIALLGSISLAFSVPVFHEKFDSFFTRDTTDAYLSVVSTTPTDDMTVTKPSISITFNYPIHDHDVGQFIDITPSLSGTWVQGFSGKQIIFSTQDFIPAGTRVNVKLRNGLPSTNGKKLLNDYTFSFRNDTPRGRAIGVSTILC